jgi:tRNA (guanine37-N1)-methyltransferase
MKIDLLSLFPEYFESPFSVSMMKRARQKGLLEIRQVNIRDFSDDPKHHRVDDRPYGGGPGMVLCPQPIVSAIRSVKREESRVVYLSAQGSKLTAGRCAQLAREQHLVLLCGHYEGIDERVMKEVDEEISIGDYVLTSGCPAALVFIDAVSRFIPGVVGHPAAVEQDSFQNGILDAPHFTGPRVFEGEEVPAVLLSGNHAEIAKWREQQARNKTARVRPDL